MVDHIFPVLIGDKRYSKEFQTAERFAAHWQRVLAQHYGHSHGTCCCPGRGDRKLAIKPRAGTYHLARFPLTGYEHANECRFYAPAPEHSGMKGYDKGVVEEGDDGQLRIRLARGIRILPAREAADDSEPAPSRPGARKPAMTLLGLLHLLWQESRLNTWYPAMAGKRNALVVGSALRRAAERVATDRLTIADVLLVPARKDGKGALANQRVAAQALERKRRLVVVAPLARYDAQKHGDGLEKLPLSWPFGMPTLYLQKGQWGRVHQSFRQELSAWMRGDTVMAIAHVEMKAGAKSAYGKILDIALMHLSEQWIPLDSGFEAVIESKLRAEGRAFEKPMRFDADEDCVFPDFWLLDVDTKFPMEVFGMGTPEYLQRKADKVNHYNSEYGPTAWWSWNAYRDPRGLQIPDFPLADRR
ncbi:MULTISPECIES: DUF1173 family protein [Pseudomonadota]|uniref:DUF1173 family protein n=1 Tax=Stutzerimonas stutzeri TaxID=316 RepID=A0A0D7DYZ7_STUST|nr:MULTISPECIES: DUF1173 family protein [Pseudomonadota]KIZ33425.1 hypothetical protein LO50_21030 [Stutzerimonas stutzeri]